MNKVVPFLYMLAFLIIGMFIGRVIYQDANVEVKEVIKYVRILDMPNPPEHYKFFYYIKVHRGTWHLDKGEGNPLGAVKPRYAIDPDSRMSDHELMVTTGYVMADGRPMQGFWDISKRQALKGTPFEFYLPNYHRRQFMREQHLRGQNSGGVYGEN